jgi:hypothetical protein
MKWGGQRLVSMEDTTLMTDAGHGRRDSRKRIEDKAEALEES